jgi:hypothetical protein
MSTRTPLLLGVIFAACSSGGKRTGDGGGQGGQGGQGGANSACVPVACEVVGNLLPCGDCLDNDGDGFADMEDPQCTGPCDSSEDSFSMPDPETPGGNSDTCTNDCLFDSNVGSGDDGCSWPSYCDPLEVPPAYDPQGATCAQSPATISSCATLAMQSDGCRSFCQRVVPNGCDCFGCCELPARSGRFVWLNSRHGIDTTYSCNSAADLADPTKCRSCTPVASCLNRCDSCELCIGETALPGGCQTPTCPQNIQPCGVPGLPRCPGGAACISGCCQSAPWFVAP